MAEQPDGPDFSRGVDAAGLEDGAMISGRVGDDPVVLARSAGTLFAVSGQCTHVGAPLQDGVIVAGQIRCPWHHARFDLMSGRAVGAPAFEPLGCYKVTERDGKTFVEKRAPEAGVRSGRWAVGRPHVAIVGGGAAGFACADWLVRNGFEGRITLLSDDADAPYDRTFCSKDYLEGKASREESFLSLAAFYDDAEIELRLNTRVRAIDLSARTLTLDPGDALGFDVLVLATGSEAKAPPFLGGDRPNVHRLRTLRDADAIIGEAAAGKTAAVIGGSFIALETAAALIERGLTVHVVAPEEGFLKAVMGEDVGRFVQRLHEEKGAILHLAKEVSQFDGRRLELVDGTFLEVDFLAAGVGVAPRTALAEAAGLATDDGVLVDERLKASADDVYAAGDAARYPDPLSGRKIRVEHWVHAERQGQHVARAILGETAPFADAPFFWSAHYGTGVRYVGQGQDFDAVEIQGDLTASPATDVTFVARYLRDGAVVAVASYNDDKAVLEAEIALEQRTPAS